MLQGSCDTWIELERHLAWELLAEEDNAEVDIWPIVDEILSPKCHLSKTLVEEFEEKGALEPECSCENEHNDACHCKYRVKRKLVALFLM